MANISRLRNVESLTTKFFEIAKTLALKHNLSVLAIVNGRNGLKKCITPAVEKKLNFSYNCDNCIEEGSWDTAFKMDMLELSRKNISPESLSVDYEQFKLPARIMYLTYEEAVDIVRTCILRNHEKKGRTGKRILYGKPEWEPEFWKFANYEYPWEKVVNFKQVRAVDIKVKGVQFLDVLKEVINNYLEQEGIL